MDIKWKNIKNKKELEAAEEIKQNFLQAVSDNKKKILNALSIIELLVSIILLNDIVSGIPYVHSEAKIIVLFILVALLLTGAAKMVFERFDRKYSDADFEKYYKELKRIKRNSNIAVFIYILSALIVLIGKRRFAYTYLYWLLYYDMEWVFISIFAIPVGVFLILFTYETEKRQSNIINSIRNKMDEAVKESIKSEKMKIDLITNVSHDLKTPLTSVIGYIELMKKEEMTDVLKDYTKVISNKTELLKSMIDKVFELAKVSSGNTEFKMEQLEMNRLVSQILADLQDVIENKKKVIKEDMTEEKTYFKADSVCMYRIVQNLIVNALKYSMDGTRIFVKTYVKEKEIFFEVINVANYPLDFDVKTLKERFVRADESRSTEGNGLGLAIVETYTNALGGKFDINTDGDTFKAVLSFAAAEI